MGGGKGDKAPDAPDMRGLINQAKESAGVWEEIAKGQIDWARGQDEYNRGVFENIMGMQLPAMEEMYNAARADRQRYETEFVPRQDQVIGEAFAYDTPERREQEAARRQADVRSAYESQRQNALQQLEGYGIDPSQTRFSAMDLGYRAQEAAQQAMVANQARYDVEDRGRQMKYDALNLGAGLPGQSLASAEAARAGGEGVTRGAGGLTSAATGAFGTAAPYAAAANRSLETAAGTTGQEYDQRLAQHQQDAAQSGALWEGVGSLAGTVLGGPIGGGIGKYIAGGGGSTPPPQKIPGFEDGGSVGPSGYASGGVDGYGSSGLELGPGYAKGGTEGDGEAPGPTDQVAAVLAEDEFVIPADVVKKKGTEFFDKMLAKYKDGGDYDVKREEEREQPLSPMDTEVNEYGAVPGYQYGGLVRRQGIPA